MLSFVLRSLLIGGVSLISALHLPALADRDDQTRALDYLQTGSMGPASISSQRNDKAQDLIDEAYRTLLLTPFGNELVLRILDCSPEQLTKHLGISQTRSFAINQYICSETYAQSSQVDFDNHPWIYSLPDEDIDKVVSLRQKNNRSYKIRFLKNDETIPLDSWTDFKTQTTTIYVQDHISLRDLKRKLLFVLAHETAIYFDQKSQLTAALWLEHPNFRQYLVTDWQNQTRDDLRTFLTAANNPLISQVLSYIRAFRVEEFWMRQLPAMTLRDMSIDLREEYNYILYPFLNPECSEICLGEYLLSASLSIVDYSLPLLSNSRYWSMKILEVSSQPPSEQTRRVRRVLIDHRNSYVSYTKEDHSQLIGIPHPEIKRISAESAQVFREILIPQDLETLLRHDLTVPPTRERHSIRFLTVPSLGNFGVEMAAGPRPRIRTGSSFSMDIHDLNVMDTLGTESQSRMTDGLMGILRNSFDDYVINNPQPLIPGYIPFGIESVGEKSLNPFFNPQPTGTDDDPAN